MRTIAIISAAFISFLTYSFAGTSQDAYDNCGPGNGYDKYLELTPYQTYTGGLIVDEGVSSSIVGNHAKVDLENIDGIEAEGDNTLMDIDHLVVYGSSIKTGIKYSNGAEGLVNFCTVTESGHGILTLDNTDVTVKNTIIASNEFIGIGWYDEYPAYIVYCDSWGNPRGNYQEWCDD